MKAERANIGAGETDMAAMTEIAGSSLAPVPVIMPEALEGTWRAIRRHSLQVPAATLRITPGRASSCGSVAWDSPVILVSAETAGKPRAVLGYLLHQAAHGLLASRGVPAVTGGGRYHNAAYRDAAQQLGLEVSFTRPDLGWSATAVSDHLAGVYAGPLRQLTEAAASLEHPAPGTRRPRSRNMTAITCQCQPPRLLRGAKATLDKGPVMCGVCGGPFEVRP